MCIMLLKQLQRSEYFIFRELSNYSRISHCIFIDEYSIISISTSAIGVRNKIPHYMFSCATNYLTNTSISLVVNGVWYTEEDSARISVTTGLWDTTPGEYNFICAANNSNVGGVWLGTFTVHGECYLQQI